MNGNLSVYQRHDKEESLHVVYVHHIAVMHKTHSKTFLFLTRFFVPRVSMLVCAVCKYVCGKTKYNHVEVCLRTIIHSALWCLFS